MEVNIGELNSTVRTTDSASLLTPEVMDRIVRAVIERWREEEGRRQRGEAERQITASVAVEED
jgi:hypothetical protein